MREKLSVRHTNGSKSLTKPSPSSVIRLAGDGGCHLPPLGEGISALRTCLPGFCAPGAEPLALGPWRYSLFSPFTDGGSCGILIEHVCGSGPVLPLFLWYFPVLSFGAGFWRAAPLSEITHSKHTNALLDGRFRRLCRRDGAAQGVGSPDPFVRVRPYPWRFKRERKEPEHLILWQKN